MHHWLDREWLSCIWPDHNNSSLEMLNPDFPPVEFVHRIHFVEGHGGAHQRGASGIDHHNKN